ncbi:hypothetical protein EJB05_47233, partial [Eragrostis curvula]
MAAAQPSSRLATAPLPHRARPSRQKGAPLPPLAPSHHQFQAPSTKPEIDAEFQKWPPGERHRPRRQILPLRRGRRKEEFSPLSVVVKSRRRLPSSLLPSLAQASSHGRPSLNHRSPPPPSTPDLGPNIKKVREEVLYPSHSTNFGFLHPTARSMPSSSHGRRRTPSSIPPSTVSFRSIPRTHTFLTSLNIHLCHPSCNP